MLSRAATPRQNRKHTNSNVEVVGKKTHAELEADWLNDFNSQRPHGRPEGPGWLTPTEMAEQAGVDPQTIRRYLLKNKDKYESEKGTVKLDVGERSVNFFRLAQSRTVPAVSRSTR